MIQLLATRYRKATACSLFLIFYLGLVTPSLANHLEGRYSHWNALAHDLAPTVQLQFRKLDDVAPKPVSIKDLGPMTSPDHAEDAVTAAGPLIGGPAQPEMSSFKSAGTDNMVNLFTGDFSYNIPLLDVGGYPVNIFYDGNVGMEQESSWVGLGWNLNPGSVTRNMRGIPDDFNGEDKMIQTQVMKPNKTFGANFGMSTELIGLDALHVGISSSLGISYNNYLGLALERSVKGSLFLNAAKQVSTEKIPIDKDKGIYEGSQTTTNGGSAGVSLGATVSSRSGLTLTGGFSLSAQVFKQVQGLSTGIGLSTSYNSRTGIKGLQLTEQLSYSASMAKGKMNALGQFLDDPEKQSSPGLSQNMLSVDLSTLRPSYIPSLRLRQTNTAYSGNFQLGAGVFGYQTSGQGEVYVQKSEIADEDKVQSKPLVGYMYYQKAQSNPDAVMDFTRFNDNEVTSHTPIISAPQYSYDVFSIQGEGTGGTIRAYRNDVGAMRDNVTVSRDKSISAGADIDPPGHFGGNFNQIKTPTSIGEWIRNNQLHTAFSFGANEGLKESVYFRNPGEGSVLDEGQYDQIGGTDLVRFQLSGSGRSPGVTPSLQHYNKLGQTTTVTSMIATAPPQARKKRSQVVNFLTAEEAAKASLNKDIRSYDPVAILDASHQLIFQNIPRVAGPGDYHKKHHISAVDVTESDGKRYIYDIPVYNTLQKDFTFSTTDVPDQNYPERIKPAAGQLALQMQPGYVLSSAAESVDGFFQSTETPAYAHSFLLTGLLSPDYVDILGDGITDDDQGSAVKFNYSRLQQPDGQVAKHHWRTPYSASQDANFNDGNRSETKDNKAIVSYGEREAWYLHSIESKTMIALFTTEDRHDGKGAVNETGGIDNNDHTVKLLRKIDLYSKPDLKKNGLSGARPIKTVHFVYDYSLCANVPGNDGSGVDADGNAVGTESTANVNKGKGKLTLTRIYFTYNGASRQNREQYRFAYEKDGNGTPAEKGNPAYAFNGSDRWGTYKDKTSNPAQMSNADYPYALQNSAATVKNNAGAWLLKKILLPSGGQMEVDYESDDYAFVQDRRATDMMEIDGFGTSSNAATFNNQLYHIQSGDIIEHDYVRVKLPQACANKEEAYEKYLRGLNGQLAFRVSVNMPKGPEYMTIYGNMTGYDWLDANHIWISLQRVGTMSPITLTALEYLRQHLPGQAFPGYDVSDGSGLQQIGDALYGMLMAVKGAFKEPDVFMQSQYMAQTVNLANCFVRLNDPGLCKYGGGHRVKSVRMKDNWKTMTQQYTSEYGQEYNYKTTQRINGQEQQVSSGVASYEPALGGEENPFQSILQVADHLPLGPTSYGAIEMPMLDAFFPSPIVGYSKVEVRSIISGDKPANVKTRSGIGRQVTEYYTAKDYPVYYSYTALDDNSELKDHQQSLGVPLHKSSYDSRAQSQGFLVATNDMHGKMKSQSSYAENDDKTPINFSKNFYRNTGESGTPDAFDFVYPGQQGLVKPGTMGVDVELMTDTREFSVKSTSLEIQGQADLFPFIVPVWLVFVWPVTGRSENTYRAVTTTKVIAYHSVLDSVIAIDKGSQVSTKNLVYDAETGSVVVNRTNNAFNRQVYSTTYPAYWAYEGMGPAYRNIDAVYRNVSFLNGRMTGALPAGVFASGDEILILNDGANPATECGQKTAPNDDSRVIWAYDTHKGDLPPVNTALTNTTPDFVFMNGKGKLYTKNGVDIRIIRSGRRNMLTATLAGTVSLQPPLKHNNGVVTLSMDQYSMVLQASAVEYKEKWQVDNDVIKRYQLVFDQQACTENEVEDCNGYLDKKINPYRVGLLGTFRPYRNMVFYGARQPGYPPATTPPVNPMLPTDIRTDGALADFDLYWKFNSSGNLVPPASAGKWVWNTQATRLNSKGLELETMDALKIYTAAQYGYNKTVPVAIASNTRYNEMMNDGFEDYGYQESLNGSTVNPCFKKHIDFSGVTNAQVVAAADANISAHTGKYVLKVNAGTTAEKTVGLTANLPAEDFPLTLETAVDADLANQGINTQVVWQTPVQGPGQPANLQINDFGIADNTIYHSRLSVSTYQGPGVMVECNGTLYHRYHFYEVKAMHYIKILQCGTYSIKASASYASGYASNYPYIFQLYNQQGVPVTTTFTGTGNSGIDRNYQCYLTPGIYKIVSTLDGGGTQDCPGVTPCSIIAPAFMANGSASTDTLSPSGRQEPPAPGCDQTPGYLTSQNWRWSISNTQYPEIPVYKDLNTATSCSYLKPIPGTDDMLHPTFAPFTGKKMVFSAWVKEDCGDLANGVPCTATSYNSNAVNLVFNDGGSTTLQLHPTGQIIEGWQRYEAYFTTPAGATQMKMQLVNSSSKAIYFDDVRMHPFNSNMKSYVYDPVNLRLLAELDENNYASFYEYDDEGTLVRTKAETNEGVKTIKESRSARQKTVVDFQQ